VDSSGRQTASRRNTGAHFDNLARFEIPDDSVQGLRLYVTESRPSAARDSILVKRVAPIFGLKWRAHLPNANRLAIQIRINSQELRAPSPGVGGAAQRIDVRDASVIMVRQNDHADMQCCPMELEEGALGDILKPTFVQRMSPIPSRSGYEPGSGQTDRVC